jgi:peptidyl-prolyl cis-trans isomerase B (cyclophilin B)
MFLFALCAACLAAGTRAQQQTGAQPAQTPKVEAQPKQEQSAAKKNARPEADAKAEPFDKATPEQMSKQCVTLATEEGDIAIEFFPEAAPESVRNFLNLAATGAYDTTVFSRVVRGFVIQGGDLATREKRTPELMRRAVRRVPDEPSAVKHVRGIVSMARTDQPDSATTHFFILAGDGPHLDGTFAAFGRVRSGMDVADRINAVELEGDKPKQPVRIQRASVAPCPTVAEPKATPQP